MVHRILSLPEVVAIGCDSACLISRGSFSKPDIFRLDFSDGRESVVFKTYALKNRLVRDTIGKFVTRREYAFLQKLKEIHGICQPAAAPSRTGLFLQWIPGKPLYRFPRNMLPEKVFHDLVKTVKEMHRAGVVHLDIGHKGNILVIMPGYAPMLLDFQSALSVKHWPPVLRRWLERIDELTLLKWKEKRFPEMLTPLEYRDCLRRKRLLLFWPWSHRSGSRRHG